MDRTRELLELLRERRREEHATVLWWALGILIAIVAIAGVAYVVYQMFAPDYLGDYEDDFEDDFDAYFEDEESKAAPEKEDEPDSGSGVPEA